MLSPGVGLAAGMTLVGLEQVPLLQALRVLGLTKGEMGVVLQQPPCRDEPRKVLGHRLALPSQRDTMRLGESAGLRVGRGLSRAEAFYQRR